MLHALRYIKMSQSKDPLEYQGTAACQDQDVISKRFGVNELRIHLVRD
jgi:hypothetical protein